VEGEKMNESLPPAEQPGVITREEAMAAYRKFIERGVTNPDDLDREDPEVKQADELFYAWVSQEDARSQGDEELQHRANLTKSMFYVDVGFNDPEYLDEVLRDWLLQDAQDAEKNTDNPERAETRRQIAAAMKKIKGLLQESRN
jgi:hypothetical protein